MRLHHVNVVVPPGETAAAVDFYAGLLGLRQIDKPADLAASGAWLAVGDDDRTQLHVSEREGERHPDSHFGLVVADLPGVLERLAAAGYPWTEQEDVFGGRRGFTRDPAGNRVELLEAAGELA